MSTSPPLRADAERNRQRLLDAARDVFADRGLSVTLDEIAKHAGVGVGTAYRRFRNKDELIDALLEARIDELTAIAERWLAHPDPWAAVRGYLEEAMQLQCADRGLKQVLFAPGHGAVRVARARQTLGPAVSRLVARAREAGVVRADLQGTDLALFNKMLGEVVDLGRDVEPDLWRRYLDILLAGIRADAPPARLVVPALDPDRFQQAMAAYKPG
ncbi:MAG TPA: helix-turn-helix domain-containing protein [Baekduia sp.]|nr:helix-turn-helix domain-containing protein [Baekduia sp.]